MKYKLLLILFVWFNSSTIVLTQQTITGIVLSNTDSFPLPGATVSLKGTDFGTTTDINGKYTIEAPSNGTLVFSFLSFITQEVPINNRTYLQIVLNEDISELEEIVVVGYGTQKKSDVTGAVVSVDVNKLQNIPLNRTDEVLQGQVAGVSIQNNDAAPNGQISIRIRGITSINGGSDPLIVVDGLQGVNLADINPSDIASLEVLKDASATAIYGSRGASGVILVTTKKGIKQKPQITYNSFYSSQHIRKKLDLMNAFEYASFVNENRTARGIPTVFSENEISKFKTTGGTDWQEEIYRPGYSQNQYLNIAGGSEYLTYSISGNYLSTKGIIIGSSYKKVSLRPNLTLNLSEKLKLNLNTFLSLGKDEPTTLNSRSRQGSPVYASFLFPPTSPIFDLDGTYSQPGRGVGSPTEYNPVALAVEPIKDNYINRSIINPSIIYEIIDGLSANVMFSYNQNEVENNTYYNEKIINGDVFDRTASIYKSKYSSLQNTNSLTYEKEFAERHNIKITGVFEQVKSEFKNTYSENRGFLTNALTYNNLGFGSAPGVSSNKSIDALNSYMGRLNYGYANKYLLTLTYRRDGASVFAKNNKWGDFFAASVAWNMKHEEFLKNVDPIYNLKLRMSYGEIGNAAIRAYQSLARLNTGSSFSFDGQSITTGVSLSTQAPNPDLKWETTKSFNAGFDLDLFEKRLSIIADYYDKNTTDLLFLKSLKEASGFQTQLVNAGEVSNKGVELALSGSPVRNNNFEWNTSIIFSKNNNKVIALNDNQTSIRLGGAGQPGFNDAVWLEVGQPIGLIKGYETDGIWSTEEQILATVYGQTPGSPKYVDQNSDGVVNAEDLVNIANALPDYTFSWNNRIVYKNLDLNVFIIGVQGNDVYNIGRAILESSDLGAGRELLNIWTPNNQESDIPGHDAIGIRRNSDRWTEDGSYLRIKNITLGYHFPSHRTQRLGISYARLYVTGTNLVTYTNYSGFDPEASTDVDSFGGIDWATFPSQKKYTFGLEVRF